MKPSIAILLAILALVPRAAADTGLAGARGQGVVAVPFRAALGLGTAATTNATAYEPTIATGTFPLSKLATNPLARANHTGTQTWATITATPTTLAGYGIVDGGGATTFAALTDKTTVDLPAINTPLATALNAKTTNNQHLRGLGNLVNQASTGGDFPVSVITIGDSFGAVQSLQRGTKPAGSYRTGQAVGGGDTGATVISDFSKVPDGFLWQVTSGGILSCGHLQTGNGGSATQIYYTLFNGAGTVQFEYNDNGTGWFTVGAPINTASISTVSIGSIALPTFMSSVKCRFVTTVGTVTGYIGQGASGPGITTINFATTGLGIEQNVVGETIWKAMIAGYKPATGGQLVYCIYADYRFTVVATSPWPTRGVPSWDASGPAQTLYNWSRAQNPTVDWMVVSPHRVDPARVDAADAVLDAAFATIGISSLSVNTRIIDGAKAQREFAVRNSTGFVDCIDLFPDFTKATAEGFYGDDIHLSVKGNDFKRSFILTNSNMGSVFGSEGYRSAIRLGDATLEGDTNRGSGVTIWAKTSDGVSLLGLGAEFVKAGLPTSHLTGTGFWTASSNVMRLGNYGGGGRAGYIDLDPNAIYPMTAGALTSGTMAKPWGATFTNGARFGYVVKTADYTIPRNTSTDYLIHYKSGSFTVTLPLARDLETTGTQGRTYIIKNSGAGTITVAGLSVTPIAATAMVNGVTYIIESVGTTNFTSFGSASNAVGTSFVATGPGTGTGTLRNDVQKIDAATTGTVAAGQTLRIMSAQVSGFASADYGNWITL